MCVKIHTQFLLSAFCFLLSAFCFLLSCAKPRPGRRAPGRTGCACMQVAGEQRSCPACWQLVTAFTASTRVCWHTDHRPRGTIWGVGSAWFHRCCCLPRRFILRSPTVTDMITSPAINVLHRFPRTEAARARGTVPRRTAKATAERWTLVTHGRAQSLMVLPLMMVPSSQY